MKTADRQQPCILITGFGPFPGMPVNASSAFARAVSRRARTEFTDMRIAFRVLPTHWRRAPVAIALLHERHRPSIALHFGVAEAARGLRLEARAANRCRAAMDAAGELPVSASLDALAPPFLTSTLACDEIVTCLRAAGYEAELSQDAGGYICNAVLFHSLAAGAASQCAVGFVHIPTDAAANPAGRRAAVSGALEIIRHARRQAMI